MPTLLVKLNSEKLALICPLSYFFPQASHKATISVTEMGTEAAAITISEWILLTTPTPVRVDRPFLVFIVENSTGSILFMGRINKPTAS